MADADAGAPTSLDVHPTLEMRVHGINKATDFSSLGKGYRIPTIESPGAETIVPVITRTPRNVWLFNWSMTNRRLTGALWALALPFTFINLAGYTGWRADASVDESDPDYDRHPDRFVETVVVAQGVVVTCTAFVWLIALIELFTAQARFVWPNAMLTATVIVVVAGALLVIPMSWRVVRDWRDRERSPGVSRRYVWHAALHSAAIIALAVFLLVVRPGQMLAPWPPPFGLMDELVHLRLIGTSGPAPLWSEANACHFDPSPERCYDSLAGDPRGHETHAVLEVLSAWIYLGAALTVLSALLLLGRALVLAAHRRPDARAAAASVVGAAAMVVVGWSSVTAIGSTARIGLEWFASVVSTTGRLVHESILAIPWLPDWLTPLWLGFLLPTGETIPRAHFVVHPYALEMTTFSITNGIAVINAVGLATAAVVFVAVGIVIYQRVRSSRPPDEAGPGKLWRFIHTLVEHVGVALPFAIVLGGALWVYLIGWGWRRWADALASTGDEPVMTDTGYPLAEAGAQTISAITLVLGGVVVVFLISGGTFKTVRTAVDTLADITGFFPIQWHPLTGLSYRKRVVAEIDNTIAYHRQRTGGNHTVIYSGHSQGSVVGLWYVRYKAPKTERIHFVTCGSPLKMLYGRFFPRFFNATVFAEVLGLVASWTNVWRATDPIASALASANPPTVVQIDDIKSIDPPAHDLEFKDGFPDRGSRKARWHLDYWSDYHLVEAVDALVTGRRRSS